MWWHRRRALPIFVCATLALPAFAGCASWRAARLYQSGTAALDAGRIDVALSELGAAARLAPEASEVHNHLGIAQLAAGRPDAARASFERAVALDCGNLAARRNLEAARDGATALEAP
jgi:Flp pilus assembly protein TadD